ncbi:hypothetical protein [Nostoc sp.]|uniref:hypothetical protein n=1 Tax=Nostoc sp. TaxID=1180 RepID=UPI002FFA2BF7
MKANLLNKPQNRWLVALVVFAGAISGSIALYTISEYSITSEKSAKPVDTAPITTQVIALGHLEPEAVTGTAFQGNLQGVVSYIGMHVDRQKPNWLYFPRA